MMTVIRNREDPTMTPDQKTLVQKTWKMAAPNAEAVAQLFYQRLFTLDPVIERLFAGSNMAAQRGKLVQALRLAVEGLDDLDGLVPVIEDLGRRHVGYGVEASHYDTVGAALLWTLGRGLGQAWTAETKAAWTEVYGLLAGVMQQSEGSSEAAA